MLPIALAAAAACAQPATAQVGIPVPGVADVRTECLVVNGKANTVHVIMTHNQYVSGNYAYTFRNLHTGGQLVFTNLNVRADPEFPLPAGVWEMRVVFTGSGTTATPAPGQLSGQWRNINIPAFYLTGRNGTDCVLGTPPPIRLSTDAGVARARSGPAGE